MVRLDKAEEEGRLQRERAASSRIREVEAQETKHRALLVKESESRKDNETVLRRLVEERGQ